jgi:hypothetical protein
MDGWMDGWRDGWVGGWMVGSLGHSFAPIRLCRAREPSGKRRGKEGERKVRKRK